MNGLATANVEVLARLFEKEHPEVLVLVGSGISQGATHCPQASWKGLLEHGLTFLRRDSDTGDLAGSVESLEAAIETVAASSDPSALVDAATELETLLGAPHADAFGRWLGEAFRDLVSNVKDWRSLKTLNEMRFEGALIATTNYDDLLCEVTGLAPITWRDPDAIRQVRRREREGILHLHGHWRDPASIVFGDRSYDQIKHCELFQETMKALWLDCTWIYVGCGAGVNDPHFLKLSEWGRKWNAAENPHYMIARREDVERTKVEAPAAVAYVHFDEYGELPGLLGKVIPPKPLAPFRQLPRNSTDPEGLGLFRSSDPSSLLNCPSPSFEEFAKNAVPELKIEREVRERLEKHGWAFVVGAREVGKTTLALRLAIARGEAWRTYYLDISAGMGSHDAHAILQFVREHDRTGVLFVIDNVHHDPALACRIYSQWRSPRRRSQLLLIQTRIASSSLKPATDDLGVLERQPENPALELRLQPEDLWAVVQHIHGRIRRTKRRPGSALTHPGEAVLKKWYRDFGAALAAFCCAVIGKLVEFEDDIWDLSPRMASEWVEEQWLKGLSPSSLANLNCLAAFATQELELAVQRDALPFERDLSPLGHLIALHRSGRDEQYTWVQLKEPGWGRLILAAQDKTTEDEDRLLFECAARRASVAAVLLQRLRRHSKTRALAFAAYLAEHPDDVLSTVRGLPFVWFLALTRAAESTQKERFFEQLWCAIESDPRKFADRASRTYLEQIVALVDEAKGAGRPPERFWKALEVKREHFVAHVLEQPLPKLPVFLKAMRADGADTTWLWEAIEARLELLFDAWLRRLPQPMDEQVEARTPSRHHEKDEEPSTLRALRRLLRLADQQQRDTSVLWNALEQRAQDLALLVLDSEPEDVRAFLETATQQNRSTDWLWSGFERAPEQFASNALGMRLDRVLSILDAVRLSGHASAPLWEALQEPPDGLATRLVKSSGLAAKSFVEGALRHAQDLSPVWRQIEDPEWFAARAWERSLGGVAELITILTPYRSSAAALWAALERQPDAFAAAAFRAPLQQLVRFLQLARSSGRESPFWSILEARSRTWAELVWAAPAQDVVKLLRAAVAAERDLSAVRAALFAEPHRFAQRAWETSVDELLELLGLMDERALRAEAPWAALAREPEALCRYLLRGSRSSATRFLEAARGGGHDLGRYWTPFVTDPSLFAERALGAEMGTVAALLDAVHDGGGEVQGLWSALEARADEVATRLFDHSLDNTLHLFDAARRHGRNMTPFWDALEQRPESLVALLSNVRPRKQKPAAATSSRRRKGVATRLEGYEFFVLASRHGRTLDGLRRVLEDRRDRAPLGPREAQLLVFLERAKDASCLAGPVTWPKDVVRHLGTRESAKNALRDVDVALWERAPHEAPLGGLGHVTTWARKAVGPELEARLVRLLLARKHAHDFVHPQKTGYANVVWALRNAPNDDALVRSFCDALCTETWLQKQFASAELGGLATALVHVALDVRAELSPRLVHPSIALRISSETKRLERMQSSTKVKVIALVGAAALCGFELQTGLLAPPDAEWIRTLPVRELPHNPEKSYVDQRQWTLWLGLREVSRVLGPLYRRDEPIVRTTRQLWRSNCNGSARWPASRLHRVNGEMMRWLAALPSGAGEARTSEL